MCDVRKWLKRKENDLAQTFDRLSAQKSANPSEMTKRNNINMLAHRFCIAPMMDWTGTSRKAKRDQNLSEIVVIHVVPNGVPAFVRRPESKRFRAPAFAERLQRKAG